MQSQRRWSMIEWIRSIIKKINSLLRRRIVAIDMGATSVRVYLEGSGIIADEPCLVALDKSADRIVAIGEQANAMIGRTKADVTVLRPMADGRPTHSELIKKMLQYYMGLATKSLLRPPRVILTLPDTVSEQEEQALLASARDAGAGKVYLMESILSCAYGSIKDLSKPIGHMVVDIGGSHTTVAVFSMGGVVVSQTIHLGGDALDEAIVAYVRNRYGIIIGTRAGEIIKKRIGALYLHRMVRSVEVKGRDADTGMPKKTVLTSKEMIEAMAVPAAAVMDLIGAVLQQTPDALLADISREGMILCGGNSLIYGFGRLIAKITDVPVRIMKNPSHVGVIGAARALQIQKSPELSPGMIHLQEQLRRRAGWHETESENERNG